MEGTKEMYRTTNSGYGLHWETAKPYADSFTQSTPYKQLTDTRQVRPWNVPKNKTALALTHDPEHPCGIMSMSNVPTNTRGEFTNTRRDFQSDRQGLFANSCFNTQGAVIDNDGVATYSNLQGAWSRVGPSTYDAMHGTRDWVPKWGTHTFEPATLRSLYDHRNVDPRDNVVPIDPVPQNM